MFSKEPFSSLGEDGLEGEGEARNLGKRDRGPRRPRLGGFEKLLEALGWVCLMRREEGDRIQEERERYAEKVRQC